MSSCRNPLCHQIPQLHVYIDYAQLFRKHQTLKLPAKTRRAIPHTVEERATVNNYAYHWHSLPEPRCSLLHFAFIRSAGVVVRNRTCHSALGTTELHRNVEVCLECCSGRLSQLLTTTVSLAVCMGLSIKFTLSPPLPTGSMPFRFYKVPNLTN